MDRGRGRGENAPVIVVTPEMEPALVRKLYDLPPPGERELYMSIFEEPVELRPQVELRGYAARPCGTTSAASRSIRRRLLPPPPDHESRRSPPRRLALGDAAAGLDALRFSHAAMATVFEVFCVHDDAAYARQAAQAAFDLLDRLELELSRFIANSDVSRINALAAGQTTRVSPETMECLEIACACTR